MFPSNSREYDRKKKLQTLQGPIHIDTFYTIFVLPYDILKNIKIIILPICFTLIP